MLGPFLVSLIFIGMGALGAFDIGEYASRSAENGKGFMPWGRRFPLPKWAPPPYRVAGWILFIAGIVLLVATVSIFAIDLAR